MAELSRKSERSPLLQAVRHLSLLATIRGDAAEQALLAEASALLRAQEIESEPLLEPLIEQPPPTASPAVVQRLRSIAEAGAWVVLELAIADLPIDLRWLLESEVVTIEELAALYHATGATSATDLGWLVESGAIERLSGGPINGRIAAALPGLRTQIARIPLGRAAAIVEPLLAWLDDRPDVAWAFPAGSIRRGEETVGDIEIIASAANPAIAIDDLSKRPKTRLLLRSERRVYLQFERGRVGVRFAEPETAGAVLVQMTGTRGHVAALRSRGRDRGWRLAADGLFEPGGDLHPTPREEAVYAALGLPYIAPEIRTGDGEIEAAQRGALPALVSLQEIRGDLHMHTTWSDGHDSVEDMIQACRALGYEYLAITDHSERAATARSLALGDVPKQAAEIARLRERYPDIAILHGVEVEIMPDGRLDFPDHVLAQFDLVLASLHDAANHSRQRLLDRYLEAMKNPLVTIITHPTNRLVPTRPGYDLDYDRLFEAAIETGTALEIDGSPVHLDMDGALARRAVAAGVTVTIDGDSHRADAVALHMKLGVTTARRGWVEPRHVLNTRPLEALTGFLNRSR